MIPFGTSQIMTFFTPDIAFFKYFFKFCVIEIWSIYFNPEETIIEFRNTFH